MKIKFKILAIMLYFLIITSPINSTQLESQNHRFYQFAKKYNLLLFSGIISLLIITGTIIKKQHEIKNIFHAETIIKWLHQNKIKTSLASIIGLAIAGRLVYQYKKNKNKNPKKDKLIEEFQEWAKSKYILNIVNDLNLIKKIYISKCNRQYNIKIKPKELIYNYF